LGSKQWVTGVGCKKTKKKAANNRNKKPSIHQNEKEMSISGGNPGKGNGPSNTEGGEQDSRGEHPEMG